MGGIDLGANFTVDLVYGRLHGLGKIRILKLASFPEFIKKKHPTNIAGSASIGALCHKA